MHLKLPYSKTIFELTIWQQKCLNSFIFQADRFNFQANRDRRGAESSYIRFGKRSSLLAPYNVKSYSCILEQVLKAKSEEELKQLLQNNDCLRLY